MLHLYVGSGKGKTTAAVGLAVRALGHGKKVLFCQFLKGGSTGELAPLEQLGAKVLRAKTGTKFLFQMNDEEKRETAEQHRAFFGELVRELDNGHWDLLVLDEGVDAVNGGLIPLADVLALMEKVPEHLEVILTGRNPPEELVERADYHTAFVCEKHPYDQGIKARRGIEY